MYAAPEPPAGVPPTVPPLPDGPHGPSTRAKVLARLSLGLTAGMAVALVIVMTHALGDPSQFVGVTVLALITASWGGSRWPYGAGYAGRPCGWTRPDSSFPA